MDVRILIKDKKKWNYLNFKNFEVYYRDVSLNKESFYNLISKIKNTKKLDHRYVNKVVSKLRGHFAIIIKAKKFMICIGDRISSIPIYYSRNLKTLFISNDASSLKAKGQLRNKDDNQIIAFINSGYTLGNKTIYKNIFRILPGQFIFYNSKTFILSSYFIFNSPKNKYKKTKDLKRKLTNITLGILEQIRDRNYDQILIPLSAGYDSRLILSGLKEINTKNIFCFSYGLRGNFEAKFARKVAEKLNVEWKFIELDNRSQKNFYLSDLFQKYLQYFDTYCSVPFRQDIYPLYYLKKNSFIKKNSVIINGNSGDFITGGHVPKELLSSKSKLIEKKNIGLVADLILKKHFSLWISEVDEKKNSKIKKIISEYLIQEIEFNKNFNKYGLYEYFEFVNRQAKFVVAGQKIYDFLNLDWQLPLWDDQYILFWQKIPLNLKYKQYLYKEMLLDNNWGNVWHDIPVNENNIKPNWIKPIRLATKIMHLPVGKSKWHTFEKKYFSYFTDNLQSYAGKSYLSILKNKNVARNSVSWHTDEYIKQKYNDKNKINKKKV